MTTTERPTSTTQVAALLASIEEVHYEDGGEPSWFSIANGENGETIAVSAASFAQMLTDAAFSAYRYTTDEYRTAANHLMDHWYGDDIDKPGETVLMVMLDQGRAAHGEESAL